MVFVWYFVLRARLTEIGRLSVVAAYGLR
jgi:hypothetical protein